MGDSAEELVELWQRAGLITGEQADAIRRFEHRRKAPVARQPPPAAPRQEPRQEPFRRERDRATGPVIRHSVGPLPEARRAAQPEGRRGHGPEPPRPRRSDTQERSRSRAPKRRWLPGFILDPPFAAHPPRHVSMRLMGIVMALLAGVGLLGALFGLLGGVLPARGTPLLWLESVAHLAASVLGMIGGYRMAGDELSGKALAIYSLALNVAAEIGLGFTHLFGPDLLLLFGWGLLYYLTAISRPDYARGR